MPETVIERRLRLLLSCWVGIGLVLLLGGCRPRPASTASSSEGIIVVNAPAAGEVRRVFVNEGVPVTVGNPLIEIVAEDDKQSSAQDSAEDPRAKAARSYSNSRTSVSSARADVVRAQVEVQRLAPLVAGRQAPQSQLDAARMQLNQAEKRLQEAERAEQSAQTGLIAAEQDRSRLFQSPVAVKQEKIFTADSPSTGTLSAVSVKPGDIVTAGQPIATVRVTSPGP